MKKLIVLLIVLCSISMANAVPAHLLFERFGIERLRKAYIQKPNSIKRFVYVYEKFIC